MPKYLLSDLIYSDFPELEIKFSCFHPLLILPVDPESRTEINGTNEDDYIRGTDGHDLAYGRQGNDVLLGSEGYDELRGGYGIDEVDYSDSCCAVNVDLGTGQGWGGHAHGDTYFGIENIRGSTWNDTLTGDAADNRIDGGRGADLIEGGRGDDDLQGGSGYYNDTLNGGAGDDELYAGKGVNTLTGGAGDDEFVIYFVDTVTTITDFMPAEDKIHLLGFYDFEYFMQNAQQVGNDVHFSRYNSYLDYTTEFIINDTVLVDMQESDFLFN